MIEAAKKSPGRPRKPEAQRTGNFSVRMPEELREQLESAASDAGRSVNAEIVKRLEESFGPISDAKLLDRRLWEIDEIDKRLARIHSDLEQTRLSLPTFKTAADRNTIEWALGAMKEDSAMLTASRDRILEEVQQLLAQISKRAMRTGVDTAQ